MEMTKSILVVEDDDALNQMLCMHFEDLGFGVASAGSCAQALEQLAASGFDLMLLDQQLPDGTGIALLPTALQRYPSLPILMMTGQHDLELAIDAIQQGAADFVHKPIDTQALEQAVLRLMEQRRQVDEASGNDALPAPTGRDLIGRSAAMLEVSKMVALSARSEATVLITGESGTGKEVVARLIHQHSGRSGQFVAVNCAAIVDTLLESELFGHEKGAFTGASARKTGRFEQAAGGTLFLDEVGELAAGLQAKLLRALQERVFERVGGSESVASDARVIAATNRDLAEDVRAGRFREDLVYRLRVVEIPLPPLRARRDDIPLLVAGLLARIAERHGLGSLRVSHEALASLVGHDWPGNVRELENLLTQAGVRARNGVITPDLLRLDEPTPSGAGSDIPGEAAREVGPVEILRTLDEVEAEHVQRVLNHTRGHKGQACDVLGISRPALDRKIAKYGLRVPGKV